ncbi:hypothetical protein [Corynebacterium sanguinis]|uniref:HTH cro/C1-type domain-containing protein n=1 Tax=Corynebacterium sanguinis TaxID=2594913 RepID=A0A6C1TVW5_9CORY|nr:hypothetical protein [Corynebacterium sanguinis]TVS26964.1 hypothetical protein EKI59_09705 [Corynebacterium sanguinis]
MSAPDIGYRLRFLREHVHPISKPPYSFAQIRAMLADQGVTVSDSHLRALFAGAVRNPSFSTLEALAKIFKVNLGVFSSDAEQWNEVENWIVSTSSQVNQRRLATARGLRMRQKLIAQRDTITLPAPTEGKQL